MHEVSLQRVTISYSPNQNQHPMRRYLLFICTLASITYATAQTYISGIFQQTDAELEYVEGVSWDKFLAENQRLNAKGYRLVDIETSGISQERTFWGIYSKSGLDDKIEQALGWADFVELKRKLAAEGYVLADVTGYALNEADYTYIGVWRRGDTQHKIWKLDSSDALKLRTDEMVKDKFFLIGVKVITSPAGVTQYLALYHHNPLPERNYVFVTSDPKVFNTDWLQRMKSNVRLIDYDRYEEKGVTYYLGVYQSGDYEHLLLSDMEKLTFEDRWDRLEQQEDMRLVNWLVR